MSWQCRHWYRNKYSKLWLITKKNMPTILLILIHHMLMDTTYSWNTTYLIVRFNNYVLGCRLYQMRSHAFITTSMGGGIVWSWPIFLKSLLKRYMIHSLSNITKMSHKTFVVTLDRLAYITSYRWFLFQLSNSEKIVNYGRVSQFLWLPSADHVTYGGYWTRPVESLIKRC